MPLKSIKLKDRLQKIKKDPFEIINFCIYTIMGRWPDAEPVLLKHKDPFWALLYARDVIKERWPEAEPLIMKEAYMAYKYARDVIKGPWPEAEKHIKPWLPGANIQKRY